jgi:hypothetical protein
VVKNYITDEWSRSLQPSDRRCLSERKLDSAGWNGTVRYGTVFLTTSDRHGVPVNRERARASQVRHHGVTSTLSASRSTSRQEGYNRMNSFGHLAALSKFYIYAGLIVVYGSRDIGLGSSSSF